MNRVLENAKQNTENLGDTVWIIVTQAEMDEVYLLIADEYKPVVSRAIDEMSQGIDYAFWWDNGSICFEG